jgi:hypothetical protein
MSHLRLQHKIRIAVVVCLSIICVILSTVRLAAGLRRNAFGKMQFGLIWISFMLHCEASIAVMAGSVPALRAVYTRRQDRQQRIFSMNRTDEENATAKSLKSKSSTMYGLNGADKEILPVCENGKPRASIAKWRQSMISFIPKRVATIGSAGRRPSPDGRKGSSDSGIMQPNLAYHAFRRQESMNQLNQIHVTHETTIYTGSQEKLWDEVCSSYLLLMTRTSADRIFIGIIEYRNALFLIYFGQIATITKPNTKQYTCDGHVCRFAVRKHPSRHAHMS